jgi:hypothetical protein
LNLLLADENIPKKALETLKQQGIDIVSVADFSTGLDDKDVINSPRWEHHRRAGRQGKSSPDEVKISDSILSGLAPINLRPCPRDASSAP